MITMRQARENCGMTVKEASKQTGIAVSTIKRIELDNRNSRYITFRRLIDLYDIGINHVYIGKESEYFIRSLAFLRTADHNVI